MTKNYTICPVCLNNPHDVIVSMLIELIIIIKQHVVKCKTSYNDVADITHVPKGERIMQDMETSLSHAECPLDIFSCGLGLF